MRRPVRESAQRVGLPRSTSALAVDESGSLGSKALLGKIGPISGALRDPGRRSTFYMREIRSPSSM
jgi:hypothetical protein